MNTSITLGALLSDSRAVLKDAGLEDPALEARILVEHFTGTTRVQALSNPKLAIDPEVADRLKAAVERRRSGEPVYRIVGCRAFYGLELDMSPATLEPRQDTEALVDEMVGFVRDVAKRRGTCRVLDLGTGTGAIALALLSHASAATAVGVDVSEEALSTARANAEKCGVGARFKVVHSDWLDKVEGVFDVIVSNPPYIPSGLIANLDPEVRDFDPHAALDGGEDGLDAYRVLAEEAGTHLAPEGRIAVEIGSDQRLDVATIFARQGYKLLAERKDLGGRDRVLVFNR